MASSHFLQNYSWKDKSPKVLNTDQEHDHAPLFSSQWDCWRPRTEKLQKTSDVPHKEKPEVLCRWGKTYPFLKTEFEGTVFNKKFCYGQNFSSAYYYNLSLTTCMDSKSHTQTSFSKTRAIMRNSYDFISFRLFMRQNLYTLVLSHIPSIPAFVWAYMCLQDHSKML